MEPTFADVHERFIINPCENTLCIKQIKVKFNRVPTNMAEIDTYLAKISKVYEANIPFVILYDATKITINVSNDFIKHQESFMINNYDITQRLMLRCAVIVNVPFMKVALNALFTFKKAPCTDWKVYNSSEKSQIKAYSYIRYKKKISSFRDVKTGCSKWSQISC